MSDPRATALADALRALEPVDDAEAASRAVTLDVLTSLDAPFDEAAGPVHVTVGAVVVSALGVVLHCHKELAIWVLPGGHVDSGEAPHFAAVREVAEETGLTATHLAPRELVHVDIHDGPRGHRHCDVRWLLCADGTSFAPAEGESRAVGWFLPREALARCAPDLAAGLGKAIGRARALGLDAVASWPP